MPKAVYATINEIPEALKAEYEQRDGRYVLKVEGDLPGLVPEAQLNEQKNKVIEFRDNNVKLLRALGADGVEQALERANLYKDFTPERLRALRDIDPEQYREMKARVEALGSKGIKDEKDIDERIKNAVATVVNPLQEKFEKSERERIASEEKLADEKFKASVSKEAISLGAKPNAIEFLQGKAKEKFIVKDGEVKAKPDQFSQAKPGEPLSLQEWMGVALKEFDFAFEKSTGGDSKGSGKGTGASRHGNKVVFNGAPDPNALGSLLDEFTAGKVQVDVHQ